jgi:hypothetical protein
MSWIGTGLREPEILRRAVIASRAVAGRRIFAGDGKILLWVFATTLFFSALLLFSVQPMFGKLILPRLGGAPSVWAVSMCFFQAVLLAGYGYAFALNRWLKDGLALMIHLALMAVTGLMLPFGVPVAFAVPPPGDAYLWLLELLVVGIGLPFFVVSANAPLLQAWFSRTNHPQAADPYFLYGASNFGSLIALLAYPLLIEPATGLSAQTKAWSAGFDILGALIAMSGILLLLNCSRNKAADLNQTATTPTETRTISWYQRSTWVALAFIPSGLVIAVTTYITTDIASVPFLWMLPLALFLSTFILVFRVDLPFRYKLVCEGLPATALVFLLTQGTLVSCLFALASFFLAALICHRELYNRRPGPEYLTGFYLWMSAGGVLGGVFSALLAPHLFTSVFEFPLLMLLALLCRPGVLFNRSEPLNWARMGSVLGAGLAIMGAYKLAVHLHLLPTDRTYLFVLIGILLLGLFQIRKWPEHRAALVLTMIAAAALSPSDLLTIHVERSFFGTHRVVSSDDGSMRILLHGTTVHGARRLKDAAGAPVSALTPATYYHPTSPMARGVAAARASLLAHGKPFSAGIVGLGAGSLACYSRAGEAWRYYEIDPAVIKVATDPTLFDFLARCLPKPDIVVGDARLTLARESSQTFGYLVVDAFSSDSVPVHLLTAEALRLYVDKLDPDGLIALHLSNRHLDLVAALASTVGLVRGIEVALVDDDRPAEGLDRLPSQVVFIARNPEALRAVLAWPDARPLIPGPEHPWTDDYSDVLSALVRRIVGYVSGMDSLYPKPRPAHATWSGPLLP